MDHVWPCHLKNSSDGRWWKKGWNKYLIVIFISIAMPLPIVVHRHRNRSGNHKWCSTLSPKVVNWLLPWSHHVWRQYWWNIHEYRGVPATTLVMNDPWQTQHRLTVFVCQYILIYPIIWRSTLIDHHWHILGTTCQGHSSKWQCWYGTPNKWKLSLPAGQHIRVNTSWRSPFSSRSWAAVKTTGKVSCIIKLKTD